MTPSDAEPDTGMDLRAAVRASVAARADNPVDDREAASVAAFLDAFDARSEPFDEHADTTHVTGSAIVLSQRGVLLHRHKRLSIWLQPGGHVDPGETPWDAARRETLEETGLDAVPVGDPTAVFHVDVHPGPRGHTHLDLRYLLEAPPHDPAPGAGESPDVAWFDVDAALGFADVGLRGALLALARRTGPTAG